jgi:hypothetical protein
MRVFVVNGTCGPPIPPPTHRQLAVDVGVLRCEKKEICEPDGVVNDLAKFPKQQEQGLVRTRWPMCTFGRRVDGLAITSWRDSTCAQDPTAKLGWKFGRRVGIGRGVGIVQGPLNQASLSHKGLVRADDGISREIGP